MAESLLVLSSVAMMRQPLRWLGGTDILILGPGRRQPRVAERYFSGEPQESKLLSAIRLIVTVEDASPPRAMGCSRSWREARSPPRPRGRSPPPPRSGGSRGRSD